MLVRITSKEGFWRRAFQLQGSVLPFAAKVAFPSAVLAYMLNVLQGLSLDWIGPDGQFHLTNKAFSMFSWLLGFMIVFRTSQSYSRYLAGATHLQQMSSSFFDAVCCLFSFVKTSKAKPEQVKVFQHTIIRLVSLLDALCMQEITDETEVSSELEVIDSGALDEGTLRTLWDAPCRPSLVFHWILSVLMEGIKSGVLDVPPPILGRAYNSLGAGMAHCDECRKVAGTPFPFPYTQTLQWLLMLHWCVTPLMACRWTTRPYMAAMYTLILVLSYWSFYSISDQLENPFGIDDMDLDVSMMQRILNKRMLVLLEPYAFETPHLRASWSSERTRTAVTPLDAICGESTGYGDLVPGLVDSEVSDDEEGGSQGLRRISPREARR